MAALSKSILDAWEAQEAQYGLPRGTLLAMAGVESSYGQDMGPSSAGAVGWHQWMPATQERFGVDPYDPVSSGLGAAQYLAANREYLMQALGREPTFSELLTSFHSGEGNVAAGNIGPQGQRYAGLVQGFMPQEPQHTPFNPAYVDEWLRSQIEASTETQSPEAEQKPEEEEPPTLMDRLAQGVMTGAAMPELPAPAMMNAAMPMPGMETRYPQVTPEMLKYFAELLRA